MCCSSCAPSREYSTPLITIVVLPTLARSSASARSGCRGAGAGAWRAGGGRGCSSCELLGDADRGADAAGGAATRGAAAGTCTRNLPPGFTPAGTRTVSSRPLAVRSGIVSPGFRPAGHATVTTSLPAGAAADAGRGCCGCGAGAAARRAPSCSTCVMYSRILLSILGFCRGGASAAARIIRSSPRIHAARTSFTSRPASSSACAALISVMARVSAESDMLSARGGYPALCCSYSRWCRRPPSESPPLRSASWRLMQRCPFCVRERWRSTRSRMQCRRWST